MLPALLLTSLLNITPILYDDEDGNGGAGGAADGGDGGGDPPEDPGEPAGDDGGADDDSGRSVSVLEDALEAERARNDELKNRLEKLEQDRKSAESKEAEDLDEANERIQELQTKAQEKEALAEQRLVDAELNLAAAEAGLKNPKRTLRLVERADIAIKDDGTVAGAKAAVEALREDMPELFTDGEAPTRTAGDGTGKGKSSDKKRASDDEPETDYERGRQAAQRVKKKRSNGRL